MSMAEKVDIDVAIIGAGSTGLLLAQGLKAGGISYRVYERHVEEHVSREWSMSLHWAGKFLSRLLPNHLRERLNEINTDPDNDFASENGFVVCNGETGEVISVVPGTMPKRVSRRKLRTLMSEGLDIQYNKALESLVLDDTLHPSFVTVRFSDASTVSCRIVVGCDGSRSRTREILIADSSVSALNSTPYTILNFPYNYLMRLVPELRAIHPVFKVSYHPKLNCMYLLTVLDAAHSAATGEVTFQNLLSWRGPPYASDMKADPSLAVKYFRELGAQFAPPFSVAAANISDDAKLFVDQGMQWDPRPHFTVSKSPDSRTISTFWNTHAYAGTVTLGGDAAHAMLPHRGQGLNNALEDAAKLCAALTAVFKEQTKTLQEAIAEYEQEMVSRGGQEVETTAKAAMAAHDWSIFEQSPMFKYGANKVQKG